MRIVILGGTVFLGPALVNAARARGHAVTVLHRGQSGAAPEGATAVLGDRRDPMALAALDDGPIDALIDTSGYTPGDVAPTLARLGGKVGRYLFVSSISVYADTGRPLLTEAAPRLAWPAGAADESRERSLYGAQKARCEDAVTEALGTRALIVRPGLIAGPGDPLGRVPWWLLRMARGGQVLAPGRPSRQVQLVDVADLATWMITALERDLAGAWHLPGDGHPFGGLLAAARRAVRAEGAEAVRAEGAEAPPAPGSATGEPRPSVRWVEPQGGGARPRLVWVDDAWLLDQGVAPWSELPLWLPADDPATTGLMNLCDRKVRAAGFTARPLADTLARTWRWMRSGTASIPDGVGLEPRRERALLDGFLLRDARFDRGHGALFGSLG